jgi:hypothetical protein
MSRDIARLAAQDRSAGTPGQVRDRRLAKAESRAQGFDFEFDFE